MKYTLSTIARDHALDRQSLVDRLVKAGFCDAAGVPTPHITAKGIAEIVAPSHPSDTTTYYKWDPGAVAVAAGL